MTFKEHATRVIDNLGYPLSDMIAEAIREAVIAEQDRCAKIAEYFWQKNDPLIKADKDTAYLISTNIRALRRGTINCLE